MMKNISLKGKTALVTGASRGIGKSIVEELIAAGATVIGISRTIKEQSEQNYFTKKIDIASVSQIEELFTWLDCKFKSIDIVVNNAGIAHSGLFTDMTVTELEYLWTVNVQGTMLCSQQAAKRMLAKKNGVIINISSIWGERGSSYEVSYATTKGAINAFTKSLARELAPSGIRVNGIQPGIIQTEMLKCYNQEELEELCGAVPLTRLGEGKDIANMVCFLASDLASYITAQIITVDGGYL
ncbi:MAG: SDR family oxidoreductase [Clostridia bacterium]